MKDDVVTPDTNKEKQPRSKGDIARDNLKKAWAAKKKKKAEQEDTLAVKLLNLLEKRASKGELTDSAAAALYKSLLSEMPKDSVNLDTPEQVEGVSNKLSGTIRGMIRKLPPAGRNQIIADLVKAARWECPKCAKREGK